MCCIFTCCGWMIDLIQRLWTFTMACCISSAVCCVLVTASMSGIALGYNYSLAEYIDLKETNVSVYLKRGVFDDEIADDMDWRRSGHMPVQGHLKDSNLVTAAPEGPEEMPFRRSGRRLDDSIIMTDDKHNFEGQLMRLTAKPPDARRMEQYSSTAEPVTSDLRMQEIMEKYPLGSLEQMKAIQELVNMRRAGAGGGVSRHTILPPTIPPVNYDAQGRRVMGARPIMGQPEVFPADYDPSMKETYQRMNPARFAVPDESIRDPANWFLAKNNIPESYKRTMDMVDYENLPASIITRPQPIRMSTEIQRPTRPSVQQPTHTHIVRLKETISNQAFTEKDLDAFRNKLVNEKIDLPRLNKEQFKDSSKEFKSEEDYEDEANKGLPMKRKKRAKRNVIEDITYSSHATSINNQNNNSSESISSNKTTRSVLVSKLKSSSSKNVFGESSSTIAIASISPLLTGETSSIMITRLSLQ